jgi:hypothetical protein
MIWITHERWWSWHDCDGSAILEESDEGDDACYTTSTAQVVPGRQQLDNHY